MNASTPPTVKENVGRIEMPNMKKESTPYALFRWELAIIKD